MCNTYTTQVNEERSLPAEKGAKVLEPSRVLVALYILYSIYYFNSLGASMCTFYKSIVQVWYKLYTIIVYHITVKHSTAIKILYSILYCTIQYIHNTYIIVSTIVVVHYLCCMSVLIYWLRRQALESFSSRTDSTITNLLILHFNCTSTIYSTIHYSIEKFIVYVVMVIYIHYSY